jgi:outer membrane lipoprotein carrier protein
MIDFIGILTRMFLGLSPTPAAPHIVTTIPLVATPGAGSGVEQVQQATAAETIDKVQAFYAGIKQVSAQFRQVVDNATYGTSKTSDGNVFISKPGKMRWDYVEKVKGKVEVTKSFVSNGTYLYVIEHANKTVSKKSLDQNLMPVAVSFLYGKGDLKAEFTPELDTTGKYGSKGDIVLKLTPKKPSAQYKNLYLVVAGTDFHVSQSIIIDANGGTNHFRFFAPDFKKPITDKWFEFDKSSVPDYRMVDLDQQQQQMQGSGSGK